MNHNHKQEHTENVLLPGGGGWEHSASYCPHTCWLPLTTGLVQSPKPVGEDYINFLFEPFPTCQTYFWVTYSFVIFIHSKMSICDNSLLFSVKREHHCLNMGNILFSTVEVNDSVFKLISEEREGCKISLSCCFYKVYYLKIMNSKDYRNHETLSGDTEKKRIIPFKNCV